MSPSHGSHTTSDSGGNSRAVPAERRLEIARLSAQKNVVRIDELAGRFGVSRETIRRDLIALEQEGLVSRVYGGGIRPEVHSHEPAFVERISLRPAEKAAMATLAAELLVGVTTVFLDVGTSVAQVADHLPAGFSGRIITNSVLAAAKLGDNEHVEVTLCGGRMRHGDLAVSGASALQFLQDVFVEMALLGSGGVHPMHGLTDFYPDEVAARRTVIENARASYVLADSSKMGRVATHRVCSLGEVTGVITDVGADTDVLDGIRIAGVEVHVAEVDGG